MKYRSLLIVGICIFLSSMTYAQDDLLDAYEVITPANAERLELVNILGRGIIFDVAWSPDDTTIAAASESGVWLYDPDDLHLVPRRLLEKAVLVDHVQFSADCSLLTAFNAHTLWQWETDNFTLRQTIMLDADEEILAVSHDASQYIVVNDTGLWLRSVKADSAPRLIDLATSVRDAEFAPDGSQVTYLTGTGIVQIKDLATLEMIVFVEYTPGSDSNSQFHDLYANRADFITYSPNSSWVFIHSTLEGLMLDTQSGARISRDFTGTNMAISPEGEYIFTYNSLVLGYQYRLYHIHAIEQQAYLTETGNGSTHHDVYPMQAMFSYDSQRIVYAWFDGLYISNVSEFGYRRDYNNLRSGQLTHSDGWWYGYEVDKDIRRWHVVTGEEQQFGSCEKISFDVWRNWILCKDFDDLHIRILDLNGNVLQEIESPIEILNNLITAIENGIMVQNWAGDRAVWWLETETWQFMPKDLGRNVAVSSSGRYIVFLERNRETNTNTFSLWDLEQNGTSHTFTFTEVQTFGGADFDADETHLILRPNAGSAIIYDLDTLQEVGRLIDPSEQLGTIYFSSDRQWIISRQANAPYTPTRVGIWNWDEVQNSDNPVMMTQVDHSPIVIDAFQNEELLLVTMYNNIKALAAESDLMWLEPVSLSPDNQLAITNGVFPFGAENPGVLEIYTAPTLELIISFETYTAIDHLRFEFDGRFILAETEGGAIYVYGVPAAESVVRK